METLAWMKMKPKIFDKKNQEGFKAFAKIFEIDTVTIEEIKTNNIAAYLTGRGKNTEFYKKIDTLDEYDEFILMGSGDSWSFESAQTIIEMMIDNKEVLIRNAQKKHQAKLRRLYSIIEETDLQLIFTNSVRKEEDWEVMDGFDEFVWCTYEGCDTPAEYNFKQLEDGSREGYNDFPASIPLTGDDIPYCEKHYYQCLENDI